MKIVVTDGGTLSPGDLAWDKLLKLGECEIYNNGNDKESIERCRDADFLIDIRYLLHSHLSIFN